MGVTIKITGLKELNRALGLVDSDFEVKYIRKALLDGVMVILKEAKNNVLSMTKRSQPGTHKKWPDWEPIEASLIAKDGGTDSNPSAWLKVWRRHAPQGVWIEGGHRIVGHKPGLKDTGGSVDPRPFFADAVKSTRSNVRTTIKAEVQGALKSICDRIGLNVATPISGDE
jgi:hypothetical protein